MKTQSRGFTAVMTLRLSKALQTRINRAAARQRRSAAEYVRQTLEAAVALDERPASHATGLDPRIGIAQSTL